MKIEKNFNFDISTYSCVKALNFFKNIVLLKIHYFHLKIAFKSLYPFSFYAITQTLMSLSQKRKFDKIAVIFEHI